MKPLRRTLLLAPGWLLLGLLLVGLGCVSRDDRSDTQDDTEPKVDTEGPPRPDLILITVDTLRQDHLSLYGYPRDTSPGLVRFGEQAVVYEQAFAHAPSTGPAMAALMTGLLQKIRLHRQAAHLPAPQKPTLRRYLLRRCLRRRRWLHRSSSIVYRE